MFRSKVRITYQLKPNYSQLMVILIIEWNLNYHKTSKPISSTSISESLDYCHFQIESYIFGQLRVNYNPIIAN